MKVWYQSKTLWFNLLALAVAMLAAAEPVLPALQGVLPTWLFAALAFGLPVVNAALRFVTKTAICVAPNSQPVDAKAAP